MGNANSKRECPLCKDDRHTSMYLMPNSPYVCELCSTEWNTKTGLVEKQGMILSKEEFPIIANSLSYLPISKNANVEKLKLIIDNIVVYNR